LAFLTYNLLKQERANNTPIYVFEFFCFALVLVGAALQYIGNTSDAASKAELQKAKNELAVAQASLSRAHDALTRIAEIIPPSIKELGSVNSVLTGRVCSGGREGEPIWGGRGTEAAKLSTNVMNNLSGAERLIESILPKK